jgi:putative oxidoreductase
MRNSGSPLSSLYMADGPAARAQDILMLAARLLIGWIFIMSGWGKLLDIPKFATTMARRGLPDFLGYIAPPVEFLGGLFMVLGFATRYTALVMILFMIIATFSSHAYWVETDPARYTSQNSNFWKNVSMTGGIVLLFVSGAGRYAVDRLLRKN